MKTDAFINVNITLNGKEDSVNLLNYADWDELKVDLKHIFNVKNVDGVAGVITKTSFGDMGGGVTLENAMNFLEYAYDNYDKDLINALFYATPYNFLCWSCNDLDYEVKHCKFYGKDLISYVYDNEAITKSLHDKVYNEIAENVEETPWGYIDIE